jgi:hypothetical protein
VKLVNPFVLACAIACTPAIEAAVVVEDTNVRWVPDTTLGEYRATVIQTYVNDDFTSVWFDHHTIPGQSLQAVNSHADEGSFWFLVQDGQEFSPATIAANQFPAFNRGSLPWQPVAIPLGTFYLGVRTGTAQYPPGPVAAYGWAKMNNSGTAITMLDNAIAYSVQGEPAGIYVGTSTPVPEPSVTWAGSALAIAWTLRRCHRRMHICHGR